MDKKDSLVSVLIPSYNAENEVHRLLDSLIKQTYKDLEIIFINDGSTDNTENIVKSYMPLFELQGIAFKYIYQDNQGQSVAINNGLKLIKGSYLVWPDSDDFYASSLAIEKMIKILQETGDEVSMIRCQCNILDEKTLNIIGYFKLNNNTKNKKYLFEDCLFSENGFWYGAGVYIAKVKILDQCINNREIYTEKNAGQNWQILLPLLYKHECLTIKENLYNIVARKFSHSRGQYMGLNDVLKKISAYENTLFNTLQKILFSDNEYKIFLMNKVKIKYLKLRYQAYLDYHCFKEAKKILKTTACFSMHEKLDYYIYHLPYGSYIKGMISKIYRISS